MENVMLVEYNLKRQGMKEVSKEYGSTFRNHKLYMINRKSYVGRTK